MKKITLFIIVLLLIFLNNTCSVIDPEVEDFADIDSEIQKEMSANQIPSLSACVIKNDKIVWIKYYGNSSVNNSLPDSTSIYPTA
jgi:CubicO group peptidase (beta-lactamase class C family)